MLLEKYLSPENETSIFKGIPIEYRTHESIRNLLMTKKFTIKYRGSSIRKRDYYYKRPQSHCHRMFAETFAIYERNTI